MAFTVDFCELDQYPRGQWNRQGFTGWRKLKVAWDDADTLISELMAYPNNLWPSGIYTFGNDYGVLDDIKVEPLGAVAAHATSDSYNSYPFALLTLTYVTRIFGMHNQILVSEAFEGGLKTTLVGSSGLQWASTGLPPQSKEVPGCTVVIGTYTLTYHERPIVPTAVWSLAGYINNAPWASLLMDQGVRRGNPVDVRAANPSDYHQSWGSGMDVHPLVRCASGRAQFALEHRRCQR